MRGKSLSVGGVATLFLSHQGRRTDRTAGAKAVVACSSEHPPTRPELLRSPTLHPNARVDRLCPRFLVFRYCDPKLCRTLSPGRCAHVLLELFFWLRAAAGADTRRGGQVGRMPSALNIYGVVRMLAC